MNIKRNAFAFLSTLVLSVAANAAGPVGSIPTAGIKGDYVEVRTASVFAGACHYNGELVTTGRDAVMAWNIASGSWNGTDLSGVRAVAAVSSTASLGDEKAARKSELLIDSSATDAQAAAFTAALREKAGTVLGDFVQVRRGTVTFRHEAETYKVDAPSFASCDVQAMPNHECCKQPHLVWFSPLIPLTDRRVGFTADATYSGGKVCDRWERSEENSAFYGSFSL